MTQFLKQSKRGWSGFNLMSCSWRPSTPSTGWGRAIRRRPGPCCTPAPCRLSCRCWSGAGRRRCRRAQPAPCGPSLGTTSTSNTAWRRPSGWPSWSSSQTRSPTACTTSGASVWAGWRRARWGDRPPWQRPAGCRPWSACCAPIRNTSCWAPLAHWGTFVSGSATCRTPSTRRAWRPTVGSGCSSPWWHTRPTTSFRPRPPTHSAVSHSVKSFVSIRAESASPCRYLSSNTVILWWPRTTIAFGVRRDGDRAMLRCDPKKNIAPSPSRFCSVVL